MAHITLQAQYPWPEDGLLEFNNHPALKIEVTPALAQRRANSYIARHITMMASAVRPTLILDESPRWQVTVVLSEADSMLGFLYVDASTGQVIPLPPDKITHMQQLAHAHATYFASNPTPSG